MITQARLKEFLHYDTDTGVFTWIKPKTNRIKAGSVAGCKSSFSTAKARIEGRNYVAITIDGEIYGAHRLAFLYVTGELPSNSVDHIDGNGWNNAWVNLRPATDTQNQRNMKLLKSNRSGVTGVCFTSEGFWLATIGVNGKRKYIGKYKSFQKAVEARMSEEYKLGYHANHGQIRRRRYP